jgi:hypothetical protein
MSLLVTRNFGSFLSEKRFFPLACKKKRKLGLGFDSSVFSHSCGGAHFLLSSPSHVDLRAGLLSWALACFFLVRFVLGIQLRFAFASGLKERKKERKKMPRQRSAGGRAPSRPVGRRAPPPAPVHNAPPPAPMQQSGGGGSMLGGLASTIAQGMAFGTGSAVAHRAVDSVMGPRTVQHEYAQQEGSGSAAAVASSGSVDSCANQSKAFQDCLNANGSDIGKCQFYVDMLNECRRGSSAQMIL